jgi:hypothetical protein
MKKQVEQADAVAKYRRQYVPAMKVAAHILGEHGTFWRVQITFVLLAILSIDPTDPACHECRDSMEAVVKEKWKSFILENW